MPRGLRLALPGDHVDVAGDQTIEIHSGDRHLILGNRAGVVWIGSPWIDGHPSQLADIVAGMEHIQLISLLNGALVTYGRIVYHLADPGAIAKLHQDRTLLSDTGRRPTVVWAA